jgi:hypothetical protein
VESHHSSIVQPLGHYIRADQSDENETIDQSVNQRTVLLVKQVQNLPVNLLNSAVEKRSNGLSSWRDKSQLRELLNLPLMK